MSTASKFALVAAFLAGITLPAMAQDSAVKQPATTVQPVQSQTVTAKPAAALKAEAGKTAAKTDSTKTDSTKVAAKPAVAKATTQPAGSTTKLN